MSRAIRKPHHDRHAADRAVGLDRDGDDEGRGRVVGGRRPQGGQAVRVGDDVVVHQPGVGRPLSRKSSRASAHPPAGPRLVSERTRVTGGRPGREWAGSTGGVLALSTTRTACGRRGLRGDGHQAPVEGVRGVVGQHDGHDRELGVGDRCHPTRSPRAGGPGRTSPSRRGGRRPPARWRRTTARARSTRSGAPPVR